MSFSVPHVVPGSDEVYFRDTDESVPFRREESGESDYQPRVTGPAATDDYDPYQAVGDPLWNPAETTIAARVPTFEDSWLSQLVNWGDSGLLRFDDDSERDLRIVGLGAVAVALGLVVDAARD